MRGRGTKKVRDAQAAIAERLGLPAPRPQLSVCFIERHDLQPASSNKDVATAWLGRDCSGSSETCFLKRCTDPGTQASFPRPSPIQAILGRADTGKTPKGGPQKYLQNRRPWTESQSGEGTPWREGREGRPRRLGDGGAEVAGGRGERVQESFLSYRLAA